MSKEVWGDGRMLLERPLSEALHRYAAQLAGMLAIALSFAGILAIALLIEHILGASRPMPSPRSATSADFIRVTLAVLLSLAAGALSGYSMSRLITRIRAYRRHEPSPYERALASAVESLDLSIDAYNQGAYQESTRHAIKSLQTFRSMDNIGGQAEASYVLGLAYLQKGDVINATLLTSDSLRHHKEIRDERGVARALSLFGDIAYAEDRFEEANNYYRRALSQKEWGRDYWDIVATALNRADVLDELDRHGEASELRTWAWGLMQKQVTSEAPRRRAPLVGHYTSTTRDAVHAG